MRSFFYSEKYHKFDVDTEIADLFTMHFSKIKINLKRKEKEERKLPY